MSSKGPHRRPFYGSVHRASKRHQVHSGGMSCSAKHFALHVVIKRDPSLFQLWSKRGAKLLFQAPYQRVAERNEMGLLHSKFRMLMTRMANDRLEQFASVKSANNGGDHIHQLQVLSFHVVGKEALRFGSQLEKSLVKQASELSTHWPYRIE